MSAHTPENPDEQKDARTPGLDEILIYDAVQRLVHRVDKQAAEIEALRDELARVRTRSEVVRFCPECGYAVGNCPTACSHYGKATPQEGHSRWCMATPSTGIPIGPCDCGAESRTPQEGSALAEAEAIREWLAIATPEGHEALEGLDRALAALDSLLVRLRSVPRTDHA